MNKYRYSFGNTLDHNMAVIPQSEKRCEANVELSSNIGPGTHPLHTTYKGPGMYALEAFAPRYVEIQPRLPAMCLLYNPPTWLKHEGGTRGGGTFNIFEFFFGGCCGRGGVFDCLVFLNYRYANALTPQPPISIDCILPPTWRISLFAHPSCVR